MSLTAVVEALVDAGATPAMILAAVRAHEAGQQAEITRRRQQDAERQARRRERASRHVTSRDVTEQDVTPPFPLPSSPQTPQQPTPTPGEQTRARKGPTRSDEPDVTERVWKAASKTSRDRSGRPALAKAVLAAIRSGATDAALIASVTEHCRNQGDFAKGVHLIVAGEHWRDVQASPANDAKPPDPAVIARRHRLWRDTGTWEPEWGPKPTEPPAHQTEGAAA